MRGGVFFFSDPAKKLELTDDDAGRHVDEWGFVLSGQAEWTLL